MIKIRIKDQKYICIHIFFKGCLVYKSQIVDVPMRDINYDVTMTGSFQCHVKNHC